MLIASATRPGYAKLALAASDLVSWYHKRGTRPGNHPPEREKIMATFRVTVETKYTETYYVEAASAEEALDLYDQNGAEPELEHVSDLSSPKVRKV